MDILKIYALENFKKGITKMESLFGNNIRVIKEAEEPTVHRQK